MANMITVKVGSNTTRKTAVVPSDTTLRKALDDNGVNYSTAAVHLDGVPLNHGDLDKTFEDMGITSNCYLLAVVKTQNA